MIDGINSYYYVDRVRTIIRTAKSQKNKLDVEMKEKFLRDLNLLVKIVPSQNIEDIENLVKVLKTFKSEKM